MGAFCQIKAVSERNDEPERACRPFDLERDGFVMGEGGVVFILEDDEFARERGARPLAEVAGYGATADMYHYTAPHPEGAGNIRAMRRALEKAGIRPEDVDYINAHGTSTKVGDIAETKGIKAVACVLAMEGGMVPPTINLEHPDPECDLDYVPNRARNAEVGVSLTNSFGFGGHNASLVLTKPSPN